MIDYEINLELGQREEPFGVIADRFQALLALLDTVRLNVCPDRHRSGACAVIRDRADTQASAIRFAAALARGHNQRFAAVYFPVLAQGSRVRPDGTRAPGFDLTKFVRY
jgi:hypothetical protein